MVYLWASLLISLGFFFNFANVFIFLLVPFVLPYVYNLQFNFNLMVFVKMFYCFLLSILSFNINVLFLFFFLVFNLDGFLVLLTLGGLYYIFASTFVNYFFLFLLFFTYLYNMHSFCLSVLLLGLPFSFLFFFKINIFLIGSFRVFILFIVPVIWSLNLGSLFNFNFRHFFFYLFFFLI